MVIKARPVLCAGSHLWLFDSRWPELIHPHVGLVALRSRNRKFVNPKSVAAVATHMAAQLHV